MPFSLKRERLFSWIALILFLASMLMFAFYLQHVNALSVTNTFFDGFTWGAGPRLTSISTPSSTNVSGYIITNSTWTLAGSPYSVVGNVFVESGAFLTIEPGVLVKFSNGTSLMIDGGLIACGNSTDEVTFTSDAAVPEPGDWGSILIRSSGFCNMTNSIIEYATTGLDFDSLGSQSIFWQGQLTSNIIGIRLSGYSIILNELTVENNTDSGIYVDLGDLSITNSLISNNNIGIKGNYGGILTISNCTISNNTNDGISTDGTPISNLLNSKITDNGGRGLSINRFLFNCNNTIISNNSGGGIYVTYQFANIYNSNISFNNGHGVSSDSGVTISGSIISNNSIDGVLAGNVNIEHTSITDNGNTGVTSNGGDVLSDIHFCNLYDNGLYEVKNAGPNLNASQNWWGTTNETLIGERVYDYFDDPSVGVVSCRPFLNSSSAMLTIFTSGVSSDGPVWVQKDGTEIGLVRDGAPLNLTVYSGAAQSEMGTFSLSIDNIRIWDSNPSTRYKFANWTGPAGNTTSNSITLTVTGDSFITAFYNTQHSTNFTFKDNSGTGTLYSEPSELQLEAPNGTLITLRSFQNQWLDDGTWTVKQIQWQGSNVKPEVAPTYIPIAGGTWMINCRVYPVNFTGSFEDSKGAALYAEPSLFKLIFPNGTTSAPLDVRTYFIQNGSTTWYSILWQGSEVAPTSTSTFDAADGDPLIHCSVYSLTIIPNFYDNVGTTIVLPSSWSIDFPNSTVTAISSSVTYDQTQAGNYSIVNIICKGAEVVPDMMPTTSLTSDTAWSPSINCLLPTTMSISLSSSTSYIGFKVEIEGNLTCNDVGLSGAPILLSYSVNSGESWNDITLVNTTLGEYSAVWMPSATGKYVVKAIWAGNSTYPRTNSTATLSSLPYNNQYVFSVESNSTISSLAFNTTDWSLSFTATGPSGTRGYAKITVAKSLVPDLANIAVYVDNNLTECSIASLDDSWLLTLSYTHSTHQVVVDLNTNLIPEFPSIMVLLLLMLLTMTICAILRRKRW